MRFTRLAMALVLLLPAPAVAQDWDEFVSTEDGFSVLFPGKPTVTQTTFKSEYGADLPARVFTANRGQERYSMTVVDYRDVARLLDEHAKTTCKPGDERSCGLTNAGRGYWREDVGGALLYATWLFIKRDAKITHLAWAWQDLVEGHEIQLTNNADQSLTYAHIAMHKNRLYIAEGTVPAGYPPPALFQQSLGFVDPDGSGVRYQTVYSNMNSEYPKDFPGVAQRTKQGGGAPPPAAPPGGGAQ
jgi:hypothetical protein